MSDARDCATGCEARERFGDGRNCAQGVIGALSGVPGMPETADSLGAGFTGGIGNSGCVCGALAGGVAMLGEYAKTAGLEAVATRELAEELSAELHDRFTERHTAACCRVIKRGQAPESDEWLSGCADITEWTAVMVSEIVAGHGGEKGRRWSPRDALSTARRVALSVLAAGALALAAASLAPAEVRESMLTWTFALLVAAAVALEPGGSAARRIGRILRVAGGACAALLVTVLAIAPDASMGTMGLLLGTGPSAALLRTALAISALVAAGIAILGVKRYR